MFDLRLSGGLSPHLTNGGVAIRNDDGKTVFSIEPPSMRDASGKRGHIKYELDEQDGGGWTLTLNPDDAWLNDPARKYPVTIDPTVTVDPQADCTIDASSSSTSYCAASTLQVGSNSGSPSRAIANFDLGAIPKDAIVFNASLNLYLQSATGPSPASVDAVGLTRAFTSAATWATYDGANSWSSPGGDFASSPSVSASVGSSAGWVSWYPTQLVQSWVDGSTANDGILLKQSSEGSDPTLLQFASSEASSNAPQLVVYWNYRVGDERQYTYAPSAQLDDRLSMQTNVANGNLMLNESALHLAGTGLDLDLSLTYNNMSGTSFQLGNGWNLTVAPFSKLFFYGNGWVRYWDTSGGEMQFEKQSDGSYTSPTAVDATLSSTGGSCPSGDYRLTFNKTDVIWCFLSWGGADEIRDRNGNTISFTWSNGNVSKVTDTKGQTTTFAYTSDGSRLASITDPTNREVQFGYTQNSGDDSWNLTSFTDAAGKVTSFGYSSANDLTKITTPAGSVTDIGYNLDGWYHAVSSITREADLASHTGPMVDLSIGSSDSDCPSGSLGKTTETMKDRSGSTLETNKFCFDKQDRVTKSYDGLNRPSSSDLTPEGSFDSSDPASGTNDEGGVTSYSYSAGSSSDPSAGENLVQVQGPVNDAGNRQAWSAQYNDSANPFAPTMNSDSIGAQLNYAYDGNGNLCAKSEGSTSSSLSCSGGSGQGQNQLKFTYDSKGQISTATDAKGTRRPTPTTAVPRTT